MTIINSEFPKCKFLNRGQSVPTVLRLNRSVQTVQRPVYRSNRSVQTVQRSIHRSMQTVQRSTGVVVHFRVCSIRPPSDISACVSCKSCYCNLASERERKNRRKRTSC
jgi:hypothetical protein